MIFNRLAEKRETISDLEKYTWTNLSAEGYETNTMEMKENTYFSCIKIISDSIAKCNLQVKIETDSGENIVKKHYLYDKLRLRPNPWMSSIDCFKSFITLFKHNGIAGLYINRLKNGLIEGLYPCEITQITVDNAGLLGNKVNKILYTVKIIDNIFDCFDDELIILRDFTLDGINASSTRKILRESLDTSLKSQKYLNSLFSNGLTNKVVVQLTSDIKDKDDIGKIQDKFNRVYSNNNRIFTVPAGYNVSALNLSLSDAQYTELRKMSKEDIASSMGVPLSKLGFVKENAKSEEQDNIKFLQDCLQVIITAIEQEMDYKLLTEKERQQGYKIRFNTNVILRLDAKTQAEVINSYVKNGVYSLNTAKRILGIELLDKDVTTFPSGQITLETLLNGQASYQKGGVNGGE